MSIARFALLFVVFLDVMSQGLVIPILNTVLMSPGHDFLPADTDRAVRQFDFGLIMAVFFAAWFFGAAYISKISDSIGRKTGILICLSGNLIGYALTIAALELSSFWLLLIARIISGFTAGNQPIAQAALVDESASEQQKVRFMGLILLALSLGLCVGPLLSGVLSDKAIMGSFASLELSFYVVGALIVMNIVLIAIFFHDVRTERQAFKFKPLEVFLTLYYVFQRPTVLKLSLVFFCSQLALNSFFVFLDTYLFSRFGFDTLQNAIALVVFGAAMGFASAFLVGPINQRFPKIPIVCVTLVVMAAGSILFMVNSSPLVAYLLIVPLVGAFGVNYPTMLALFSAAVDETQQGWVMGVSIAIFTLGAGLVSVLGGELMRLTIEMPMIIAAGAFLLALLLILTLWRGPDMRALDRR